MSRIAENGSISIAFSTDGCSGGLSVGWTYLSDKFPDFAAKHGERPPWETCCIAHDRRYHAGGAEALSPRESFDQRKEADRQLKFCVVETGVRRAPSLQDTYGLSKTQIKALYEAIAELMYRAVRFGGVPCTDQPWRWGYGWPKCS